VSSNSQTLTLYRRIPGKKAAAASAELWRAINSRRTFEMKKTDQRKRLTYMCRNNRASVQTALFTALRPCPDIKRKHIDYCYSLCSLSKTRDSTAADKQIARRTFYVMEKFMFVISSEPGIY